MTAKTPAACLNEVPGIHLFNVPNPSSTLQLSVVVPVRNEAHHLFHTLEALRQQQDALGQPLKPALYEVLVLVNNTTDDSLAIARAYGQKHPEFPLYVANVQLPPELANIGTVRRLLMDEACRRLSGSGRTGGIIASTDGDTVVDPQWVWYIMAEIGRGADAVGGRILTRPDSNPVRRFHLRDVTYRTLVARLEALLDPCPHDPWPRHHQHFGASVAVTCAMYEKVGRLPSVPYLEDEAFYRALLRVDARVRQSPLVRVVTSARTQGRVEVGFSEQLRCWATMSQSGQSQCVEPASALASRFRCRQQLRQYWANGQRADSATLTTLAAELCVSATWLGLALQQHKFFGAFWQAVERQMGEEKAWCTKWTPTPIDEAIRELRHLIRLAEKTPVLSAMGN